MSPTAIPTTVTTISSQQSLSASPQSLLCPNLINHNTNKIVNSTEGPPNSSFTCNPTRDFHLTPLQSPLNRSRKQIKKFSIKLSFYVFPKSNLHVAPSLHDLFTMMIEFYRSISVSTL
jgi:hypothetical protein